MRLEGFKLYMELLEAEGMQLPFYISFATTALLYAGGPLRG